MESEDRSKCPKCGNVGTRTGPPNGSSSCWIYPCGSRWFDHHLYPISSTQCNLILMIADRDKWKARFEQLCRDTTEGLECSPGCNSYDHADDCELTNPAVAFRKLQADVAKWKARAEKAEAVCDMVLATSTEYYDGAMLKAAHEALADSAEVANG